MTFKKVASLMLSACIVSLGASALISRKAGEPNYQAYCEEIGRKYCVSPELLEAIIEADPLDNDGVGVMRLDPSDQQARMKQLGVTDLTDDYDNITVGAAYMLDLFEELDDTYTVVYTFVDATPEDNLYVADILVRAEKLEDDHLKHSYW